MSRNNNVFQVLVTKGDQRVLPAGQAIDTLAPNQIGVFDADTNLSIDGSSPTKNFFLAVGVDRDGDATVEDINTSAGQLIQRRNMRTYTFRPHTAAAPMIAELTGFTAECDTDYAVKLEFRNQEIYRRQGYNQFTKTYAVRTSCCENCNTDCPSGNCQELANLIVDEINADTKDGLATAALFVNQATLQISGGASSAGDITVTANGETVTVTLAGTETADQVAAAVAAAFAASTVNLATVLLSTVTFTEKVSTSNNTSAIVFGAGATGVTAVAGSFASAVVDSATLETLTNVCAGVRMTTVPVAVNRFCDINLKYYNPRQTVIIPSLVEGFNCNGTVTITQEVAFEEGSGYDIKQLEYKAGGWNGRPGPYKVLQATGTAQTGFEYFAEDAVKYDQYWLGYDQESVAGWIEHKNGLETCIAIPDDDTTTRDELAAVLDGLFSPLGFDRLADDAAASSTVDTVVEETADRDDTNLDGIG